MAVSRGVAFFLGNDREGNILGNIGKVLLCLVTVTFPLVPLSCDVFRHLFLFLSIRESLLGL